MKNEEMALLFSEATHYIQKYHGKTMEIGRASCRERV